MVSPMRLNGQARTPLPPEAGGGSNPRVPRALPRLLPARREARTTRATAQDGSCGRVRSVPKRPESQARNEPLPAHELAKPDCQAAFQRRLYDLRVPRLSASLAGGAEVKPRRLSWTLRVRPRAPLGNREELRCHKLARIRLDRFRSQTPRSGFGVRLRGLTGRDRTELCPSRTGAGPRRSPSARAYRGRSESRS
jgi:hypothetical protein